MRNDSYVFQLPKVFTSTAIMLEVVEIFLVLLMCFTGERKIVIVIFTVMLAKMLLFERRRECTNRR